MPSFAPRSLSPCAAAVLLLGASLASAQTCSPGWESAAPVPGVAGAVRTLAVHDLGAGPRLYVGGSFAAIGSTATKNLARLGPAGWESIGDVDGFGTLTEVNATAVYDDGTGPALYVGGVFATAGGVPAQSIAKWNGTTWSDVGAATFSGRVTSLAVYDDGTGAALYVGGEFASAAGIVVNGLARWNGATWSAVGLGLQQALLFGGVGHGLVYALQVASLPAGAGERLYVGGVFSHAGGSPATCFASYGGSFAGHGTFAPALSTSNRSVRCFALHDFGAGPRLAVGGTFTAAGGATTNDLVAFDGSAFAAAPPGLGTTALADGLHALASFDLGGGPTLFAGGSVFGAGSTRLVRALTGGVWSTVATLDVGFGDALAAVPPGVGPSAGPQLWIGGGFVAVDGRRRPGLVAFDGAGVVPSADGFDGPLHAVAAAPVGGDELLFVGGAFETSANGPTARVAAFDGASFSPLGTGTDGDVHALAGHDDGSGAALFAGGAFSTAGGVPSPGVARWDGASWAALGAGCAGGPVLALLSLRSAPAPTLVAAGRFTSAGGVPARVAAWTGGAWVPLAAFIGFSSQAEVRAMIEFDDGAGPALYVGGDLTGADAVVSPGVVRFRNGAWEAVGAGFSAVNAFAVFDDGAGPALYCGPATGGVFRWNGATWTSVGSPPGWVGGIFGATTTSLAVFDDGTGPRLYALGTWTFNDAVGQPIRAMARYDGVGWQAVGGVLGASSTGTSPTGARRLAVSATGGVERLYAAGTFNVADTTVAGSLAGWTRRTPRVADGPTAAAAPLGGGATFDVTAFGAGLSYQWSRDGVPLAGANASSLTVSGAAPEDFARYACSVTNACGAATSAEARLSCDFTFVVAQPYGAGSLGVANVAGLPGAAYLTAATFLEPANAASPGLGPWFGLFIDEALLFSEWVSQGPPFVGALDGAGVSWFELPAGTLAGLVGAPLYGVSLLYDPTTFEILGTSNVAGTTLF